MNNYAENNNIAKEDLKVKMTSCLKKYLKNGKIQKQQEQI